MSDKKKTTYISRENGQKVTADEPREDLERSALWYIEGEEPEETGFKTAGMPSDRIAGPVNKSLPLDAIPGVEGQEKGVNKVTDPSEVPAEPKDDADQSDEGEKPASKKRTSKKS